jgi:hypothetical protein
MSWYEVSIDNHGDYFNNVVMTVKRRLDEAEARQLYALLSNAYTDGWHDHRVELEKQRQNPDHPITQHNPYKGDE